MGPSLMCFCLLQFRRGPKARGGSSGNSEPGMSPEAQQRLDLARRSHDLVQVDVVRSGADANELGQVEPPRRWHGPPTYTAAAQVELPERASLAHKL